MKHLTFFCLIVISLSSCTTQQEKQSASINTSAPTPILPSQVKADPLVPSLALSNRNVQPTPPKAQPPPESSPRSQPTPLSNITDSDEYHLVLLDRKGDPLPISDPHFAHVRQLLQSLSRRTGDDTHKISDVTSRCTYVLRNDYGKEMSNERFLQEMDDFFDELATNKKASKKLGKMSYEDAAKFFSYLQTGGNPPK